MVHGRVQGVGFRWSTATEARRLGAAGWVANRPDGTVEVVVEGDEATVAALLDHLSRGPRAARVTRVEVHEEEPVGDEPRFEVRP